MTSSGPKSSRSSLWSLLAPVRGRLSAAILVQIVASVSSVVPFWALSVLVDRALGGQTDRLGWPLVVFVSGLGVTAGLSATALFVSHLADVALQAELRLDLADKTGVLPLDWFEERSSGDIRQLLNDDVRSLHQFVAHTLVEAVGGVLTPAAGLAVCYVLDWRLGLAATAPIVIYAVLFSILAGSGARTAMTEINDALLRVSAAIVEYVNGIAVLKIFAQDDAGFGRFADSSREFRTTFERVARPQIRAQSISVSVLSAPVVGLIVLGVAAWGHSAGWASAGPILVVTTVGMLVPASVSTVALSSQARSAAMAAGSRVLGVLEEPDAPARDPDAIPADGSIVFEGVSYAYPDGELVVHEVDLSIAHGSTVALVGMSGSGKSTLAALMARLREPSSGRIRVGGVDLSAVDEVLLRRHVAPMLQNMTLLRMSLHDNIALARPDATRAEVIEAARKVGIDDRITSAPKGYDSIAGVDLRLSGGEVQRIVIARTILADSAILVLDEATAATDPESEHRVQQAVDCASVGRTLVMIAHRLSTVVGVDQIFVIDRGRVVQAGTHAELIAVPGRYLDMWSAASTEVAR